MLFPTSTQPNPTQPTRTAPVGAIVGGAIGGVAVIAAIIGAVCLCRTGRLKACKCCGPQSPAGPAAAAKGSAPSDPHYPVMGPAFAHAAADALPPPPAYVSPVGGAPPTGLEYPVAEVVSAPTGPTPAFAPTPPPAYQGPASEPDGQ